MNIKNIIINENIKAKKKFGQNFLIDQNVLNNIITASDIENKNVIEIGPGLGSLTEHLVKKCKKVVCYEIDDDMVNILNQNLKSDNLVIVKQDFLKVNLEKEIKEKFDDEEIVLVANLPYYITTAILTKVLEETKKIKRIVVMMQKEVAQRLTGKPSTKDYNSLSVLMQYYTNVELLFNVSPNCFIPSPKVDSSVILIQRKEKLQNVISESFFLKLNRVIFSQRRKTLYNNIKNNLNFSKEEIEEVFLEENISHNTRAEELSVEKIVNLANRLTKYR